MIRKIDGWKKLVLIVSIVILAIMFVIGFVGGTITY